MKIKGVEGMTVSSVRAEVANGARFVAFNYCISALVITFKRSSDIYFIRAGEGTFSAGIGYTLLSLVFGWWGIPWGPIYTIEALIVNTRGGRDLTSQVLASMNANTPMPNTQPQ
jgi:hypothetical protein